MTNTLSQQASDPLYFEQVEFSGALSDKAFHGFFSRRGGVSKDVYATLNCGPGSNDDSVSVEQNRKIVSDLAGCDENRLLTVHQVHGDVCVYANRPWGTHDKPKADAVVTDIPGLALGVLTADCAPVLFYGRKEDGSVVVAAAHAGWGGALKGVLGSTVKQMEALGAVIENVHACIGPCISQSTYEVSEEFSEPFIEEDDMNEKFFMSGKREGHLMFDLPGYCAFKLARAGLKRVYIKDLDTYFNEEDFFSYRRSTHRHEKDYGRQISVVMIKD